MREAEVDYYTDAITYTKVKILDRFEEEPAREARRSHGEVHVTSQVVGFKKIKFHTNENVGAGDLQMPENEMHTTSYWLTIPREVMRGASLRPRGAARRGGGPGLHPGPAGRAVPDVRPARPGGRPGRQRAGRGAARARAHAGWVRAGRGRSEAAIPAPTTSRTSSSMTTTRAASACPSRSTACTTGCSARAVRSSRLAPAATAVPPAWAPWARWAAAARRWRWLSWTRSTDEEDEPERHRVPRWKLRFEHSSFHRALVGPALRFFLTFRVTEIGEWGLGNDRIGPPLTMRQPRHRNPQTRGLERALPKALVARSLLALCASVSLWLPFPSVGSLGRSARRRARHRPGRRRAAHRVHRRTCAFARGVIPRSGSGWPASA